MEYNINVLDILSMDIVANNFYDAKVINNKEWEKKKREKK
jgi:hypothetical protein